MYRRFRFHQVLFICTQNFFQMKFLVIQTAFIGDVVLATPVVEKLRRFFPDAPIDFLLRKGNEKLLSGHPHIRQVLVWDKKRGKYSGLFDLIHQIRREKYDWVINCQRFAASGLLTFLSGASKTVGFDKNPFSFSYSRRVSHRFGTSEQPIHEVERNLDLIEHLTDGTFERPRLYPSEADYEKTKQSVGGKKYVCLAPTSVWFTKQYPAHRWVKLIYRISPDCQIFLLGGKEDMESCEAIRSAAHQTNVQNLAGQLSFLESAALMQGAAMNYANDSAPVHIASAVNAPVTTVFCSTIPAFGFMPLSDIKFIVETTEDLACRPCGLHGFNSCPKGHFACAESIPASAFQVP